MSAINVTRSVDVIY
jgi:hypothetical protein